MKMDQFQKLDPAVKAPLSKFGITKPTVIQRRAIPPVLEGKNSLLVAPTGTGKTEAALLPIFSNYLAEKEGEGIAILYIAPLRALNRDMLERLQRWKDTLDMDIQVRHGDTSKSQRRKQALDSPEMLITTPETLQAILPGSRMKEHLSKVGWLVVDEVHELAESKRGAQLVLALERLVRLAGDFQRVGLSATVGDRGKMASFLAGSNRKVEVIDVSSAEEMSIEVGSPMPTDTDAELSDKLNAQPSMVARLRRMKDLIEDHESTLAFVNTRETSETLGSRLKFWDSNFPVAVHHGSLSRDHRISSEEGFRNGEIKCLICTSSMELGIDIGSIDYVLQYGSPRQVKRLIQRVGRSGHKIGSVSEGLVIAADPDDITESSVIVKKALSQELEPTDIHENALDVLAHQIVGFNLDGIRDPNEILELVRDAYPYRNLTESEYFEVLQQLQDQGILWSDEGNISRGRRAWKYYYGNLSMIPDIRRYYIKDMVSGSSIGVLDEEFVVSRVEVGTTFICKGEAWQVVEVEEDQIRVEPIDDPYGAIPAWEGELIPVDFQTAVGVGEYRSKVEGLFEEGLVDEKIAERLAKHYPADMDALEWSVSYLREHGQEAPVPTHKRLLLELYDEFAVLHAPFGTHVNRTLAQVLSALLSTRIGESVRFKSDPYRVAFRFPDRRDIEVIEETLMNLEPEHLDPILEKILEKSSMFRWRLLHVAKRFGAIEKDADFSEIRGRRLVEAYQNTPLWDEAEREVRLEKLDLSRLEDIVEKLRSGEIKVERIRRGGKEAPTPMGLPILNELSRRGEIAIPERAEREIIKALKRRLHNKGIKLLCLNCLAWSSLTKVRRISESPECGNCGARLLALVPQRGEKAKTALKKERSGKELDEEEGEAVRRAKDTANLIITHGKEAIIAMAGRGVGPATASRILSMQYDDENRFYRSVLEAERQYARTHRFWD